MPRITTMSGVPASVSGGGDVQVDGTNLNVGQTLNFLANYSTNDAVFSMSVAARINELTGDAQEPMPYSISISNQAALLRGQTIVLTQEIPTNVWQPDHPMTTNHPCSIIVAVTPEVIDPAGNVLPYQ